MRSKFVIYREHKQTLSGKTQESEHKKSLNTSKSKFIVNTACKPSLVMVNGAFSALAERRSWRNLEPIFNPRNAFREVHFVALGDEYNHDHRQFGTVFVDPIQPLPRGKGLRLINYAYLISAAMLSLRRIVRDYRIDLIVQLRGHPILFGLPAVLTAQWAGLPSVISLGNDYESLENLTWSLPLRWIGKLIWPYLLKNCTGIRSKSSYIADFALARGVPEDKICVIPNKEVLETFQNLPSKYELEQISSTLRLSDLINNSTVVLTVARLKQAKNLERMMEGFALASQRQPEIIYLIVGEGPLRPKLEDLAQRLGVAERVRFLGYFSSHDQLRLIYHLSDVFLFATLYEGQSRVVMEALLSKLPIICANYGQVCEVVEDGRDGLWVDPLDVGEIATAITRLAKNADLRDEMSQHSGFYAGQYSIETVSSQEADFYLSTIERYHKRRSTKQPWTN